MTIKSLIIKYLIIALAAFLLGTFFPNPIAKKKTESAIITWVKNNLGFGPPRFEYHTNKEFIQALNKCIDYIYLDLPINQRINRELMIAQAIVESDYGQSRFAIEGNNLYGIRVWSKDGMLPHKQPDSISWRVRVFKTKCDSVKYYIEILNTKQVYSEFRKARDMSFNRNSIAMAKALDNFSTNKEYEKHVIDVIKKLRNESK
jgi:flagellum-specific peptidoglycan hydrolase FlgJ